MYVSTRPRVVALVEELSEEEAARPVPGTPRWSIKDLVCHLTGLVGDFATGNLDGAGSEAWTARHVEERKDKSLREVLAEWSEKAPAFEEAMPGLGARSRAPAFDIVVHEHDIRGALQISNPGDAGTVDAVLQAVIGGLGHRFTADEVPALRIEAGSSEWVVGPGEPAATVRTEPFELFRALFGRRSAAQVRAWKWDGDPTPYLAHLNVFGP
ncbi:MAG: hypothetical protein QOG64_1653, partial [Acidimicrobiaceae bacterium]|nr:hypothetical protein [Acidimicrobiaceae bacterium]